MINLWLTSCFEDFRTDALRTEFIHKCDKGDSEKNSKPHGDADGIHSIWSMFCHLSGIILFQKLSHSLDLDAFLLYLSRRKNNLLWRYVEILSRLPILDHKPCMCMWVFECRERRKHVWRWCGLCRIETCSSVLVLKTTLLLWRQSKEWWWLELYLILSYLEVTHLYSHSEHHINKITVSILPTLWVLLTD